MRSIYGIEKSSLNLYIMEKRTLIRVLGKDRIVSGPSNKMSQKYLVRMAFKYFIHLFSMAYYIYTNTH